MAGAVIAAAAVLIRLGPRDVQAEAVLQIREAANPEVRQYMQNVLARAVTLDLAGRFIDGFDREQKNQNALWIQTWKDQIESAAGEWEQAMELARKSPSARTGFDAELARQHYAGLKTKLAGAQQQAVLLQRRMGPAIEILDTPAVPPEAPARWPLPVAGALLGLIATAFVRGFR